MAPLTRFVTLITLFLQPFSILAHGDHHHNSNNQQKPLSASTDWATRHMAEEHNIQGFDAETFFTLHDFSSQGAWSTNDIQRLYGLFDKSNTHVPESARISAAQQVLDIFDTDKDGSISRAEFLIGWEASELGKGARLPDLGFGPGHHGDDEYEYEIHHWEKYHNEDTTMEELTHPEDIEHFKKHEEEERMEEERERLERQFIIEANIPEKFLH